MSIEDTLRSLGIVITGQSHSGRTGNLHFHARCPYHHGGTRTEHTPSWDINAETGLHHCHSCGFGGSLGWLIHKVSGAPYAEAMAASGSGARAVEAVRKMDAWAGDRRVELPPMNEARVKMYGRPPQWAMDKRHLSEAACDSYDVRWADPFIHGRQRIEYPDCWITPIREPVTGVAIGMQVKQETGDRFFRNLPASVAKSSTVFGYETLANEDSVYVVESPLDAVYLSSLGYKAVASMGARVSSAQMELLIAKCSQITLALDNDLAGRSATYDLISLYPDGRRKRHGQDYSRRIPLYLVNYAHGEGHKDVGEMSAETTRTVLDEAFPIFQLQMIGRL